LKMIASNKNKKKKKKKKKKMSSDMGSDPKTVDRKSIIFDGCVQYVS